METNELIENHISYAKSLARKKHTKFRRIPYNDLLSSAYEGLCDAAKTYKPDQDATFSTHAYKRIDGCMNDHIDCVLKDKDMVSLDETRFHRFSNNDPVKLLNRITEVLPPLGAKMVKLFYLDNLDAKEIGREFGITPQSAWSRLSWYRNQLRDKWDGEYHLLFES